MRFLVDECTGPSVARWLSQQGYDVQLNTDRADVIIPASEIYISAMKWAHAKQILVPNVGLKDRIMQMLYERHRVDK